MELLSIFLFFFPSLSLCCPCSLSHSVGHVSLTYNVPRRSPRDERRQRRHRREIRVKCGARPASRNLHAMFLSSVGQRVSSSPPGIACSKRLRRSEPLKRIDGCFSLGGSGGQESP